MVPRLLLCLIVLLLALPVDAQVLGPQPVYFVALRLQGDPPFSSISGVGTLATQTDSLIRFYSRQHASLAYTVYGPFGVSARASDGSDVIIAAGKSALLAAGVPIVPGTKRLYVLDPALYGGGGGAYLCGDDSVIRGGPEVAAHEYEHTICLHHVGFVSSSDGVGTVVSTSELGYPEPFSSEFLGWSTVTPIVSPGNFTVLPWQQDTGTAFKITVDSTQPAFGVIPFTLPIYLHSEFHALKVTVPQFGSSLALDLDPGPGTRYSLSTGESFSFLKGGQVWALTVTGEDHFTIGPGSTPPPAGDSPNCTQSTIVTANGIVWTSAPIDYSWHFSRDGVLDQSLWGDLAEPNPLLWADTVLYAKRRDDHQWYRRSGSSWVFQGAKPSCAGPPPPNPCVDSPNIPLSGGSLPSLANGHLIATKNGTISGTDERGCPWSWTP